MSETDNSSGERWRAIPGYEGLYEVSDIGRVRSLDRTVPSSDGNGRSYPGRVLRQRRVKPNADYRAVTLSKAACPRMHLVHRLVLLAFVGPEPDGMESCHNNGVSDDNRVTNLRWDTRSENAKDRTRHGTGPAWAGKTHCKRGHEFTPENTIRRPLGRECRACTKIHQARYLAAKRVAS